jgi:hypothetical protein
VDKVKKKIIKRWIEFKKKKKKLTKKVNSESWNGWLPEGKECPQTQAGRL